jgi:hypothetical protein
VGDPWSWSRNVDLIPLEYFGIPLTLATFEI